MAITTIIPDRLSIARETRVIFASGVTVATNTDFYTAFAAATGSNVQALMKNITISPPEVGQELTSFMGVDTNNFQNQLYQEKPPTEAKITGTLVLDGNETFESLFLQSPGAAISSTPTYTRYQIGKVGSSVLASVLINISGATGRVLNVAIISGSINKWGDLKLGGADGHWEQDISVVGLPSRFYVEYKD